MSKKRIVYWEYIDHGGEVSHIRANAVDTEQQVADLVADMMEVFNKFHMNAEITRLLGAYLHSADTIESVERFMQQTDSVRAVFQRFELVPLD